MIIIFQIVTSLKNQTAPSMNLEDAYASNISNLAMEDLKYEVEYEQLRDRKLNNNNTKNVD